MTVGFTSVVGDMLHPGHIAMIQECRKQVDYLIVGLICDPTDRSYKNKPIESVFERWYRLSHCEGVDEVIPMNGEADLALALQLLDYDVRFVGEEYKGKMFTGKNICEQRGIPIIYNRRGHGLSSTALRRRVVEAEREGIHNGKVYICHTIIQKARQPSGNEVAQKPRSKQERNCNKHAENRGL